MKLKNLFLLLAIAAISSAESHGQSVNDMTVRASEGRALDGQVQLYIRPLVAEVEVDKAKGRINEVWEITAEELASRSIKGHTQATIENLKAYGVFKTLEKHNCDIVLAPLFDVAISKNGASVRVIGFPGSFKNWEIATDDDLKRAAAAASSKGLEASPELIKLVEK